MTMALQSLPSKFETLPNELLLEIFKHFTARELYGTFRVLNRRLRSIVDNVQNLNLTLTAHEYREPLWLTLHRVTKLRLERVPRIDLRQFPNLHSLEWISPSAAQLQQVCTLIDVLHLHQLSVFDMPAAPSTARFQQLIFSNRLAVLRKCSLSTVDARCVWSLSPSLRAVRLRSVNDHQTCTRILAACPNLTRLDLHFAASMRTALPSFHVHVALQRLYLTGAVSLITLEQILSHVPTLVHLDVKSTIRGHPVVYFQQLSRALYTHVLHLRQFDCDLLCNGQCENMGHLRQLHPCFARRLQYLPLTHGRMRVFTV